MDRVARLGFVASVMGMLAFLPAMSASAALSNPLDVPAHSSNEGWTGGDYRTTWAGGTGPVILADRNFESGVHHAGNGLDGSFSYGFKLDANYSLDGLSLDAYPGQNGLRRVQVYTLSQADYTSGSYGGAGTPSYGDFITPSTGWTLFADVNGGSSDLANHVEVTGLTPKDATWVSVTWYAVNNNNLEEVGLNAAVPEPASLALLGLAGLALMRRRRA